ncbi:MAG: thioredoxin family protein [Janthinobacterium lividum]
MRIVSWLGSGLLALGLLASSGCKGKTLATPEARKQAKQPFTPPPAVKKHLYPPVDEANADIAAAETRAAAEHKRVLLDFGGDWCGDCQVLDIYFHQEPRASLLDNNFVKVNVNIGHEDANLDLAHKYGVPVQGVPALAVLAPNGQVLYAQNKEFSDMRYMEPASVTDFLTKWKP